jgi:undecaprenyl-diphosphatase
VRPALLLWAAFIALAQVYVGVHYPGDVLVGGLLGAWIGWIVARRVARVMGEGGGMNTDLS